jgi:hypothetical protein
MNAHRPVSIIGVVAIGLATTLHAGEGSVPTLAQADAASRVRPQAFADLPPAVRTELDRRGCDIPQSYMRSGLHNVIAGAFFRPGQKDWAVLCIVGDQLDLLVFPTGALPAQHPTRPWRDTVLNGRWVFGFNTLLRTAGAETIRAHAEDAVGPAPPSALDHLGVELYCCESVSTTYYWHDGRWLTLSGAD